MQQPAQLQQSHAARPAAVAAPRQVHTPLVHGGQSGAAHHLPSSSTLQLNSHTGQNLLVGQHQPRAALQLVNGNQLQPETSNKRQLEKQPEHDTQAAAMSQQRSLAQASSSASHSQVAHPAHPQMAPSAAVASTSGLHDSTADPSPASSEIPQQTPSAAPAAPCAPSSVLSSVPSSVPCEPDAGPPGFPRFAPSRAPAGPPGLPLPGALGASELQFTGQMVLEDGSHGAVAYQQQHDQVGYGLYYEQEAYQVCD